MFGLTTKAFIAVTEGLRRFKEDKRGVTAIEYGLIAVLIAAFIIVVFNSNEGFIAALKEKFAGLATDIKGVKTQITK
ncbi:pilus assembly protein Flp/PilA [Volucribacter psittacicida]|uniref:Pilus assembly protein Flp/PilA n=1 Tax=Volucribacter psittacicida TaxID=203482 RepID=A0A4R1FVN9_9PAST|nr:Flp family type IVb pilin [Volucribacter psittacicida]TCJ97819.1 pilus assembly protein Flp/PilA [Volucribacter psittacicida]